MKKVERVADEMIWIALIILTGGLAWIIKFIIQRGVRDGLEKAKDDSLI